MYPIQMLTFTKLSTTMIVVASILAGCSPDDPIITEPAAVFSPEMNVQEIFPTTTTSIPQEPVQITIFQPVPQAVYTVMDDYSWMEQGIRVADLQKVLGIEADGIYGPGTRSAHVAFLDGQGVPLDGVPTASGRPSYSSPAPTDGGEFWPNVERWRPTVTDAVYAWGGSESDINHFLRIMQCESAGRPDAKNPNSSASGLMQQLARYWPERAAAAGIPGADVFDPYANIWVSAWLLFEAPYGGYGHWVCK